MLFDFFFFISMCVFQSRTALWRGKKWYRKWRNVGTKFRRLALDFDRTQAPRFKNKIIFKKLIRTKFLAPVCYSLRAIIAYSFFELQVEGKFCASRKEKTNEVSIIDTLF